MTLAQGVWWVLITLTVVNVFMVVGWTWLYTMLFKKRTYAVLLKPDKTRPVVRRVDTSERVYKYKGRAYNLDVPWIRHGEKQYLFYHINGADPINPLDQSDSRMPADTYHANLSAEMLKSLNRAPFAFDFSNPVVKWGAIIIGGIIVYNLLGGGV